MRAKAPLTTPQVAINHRPRADFFNTIGPMLLFGVFDEPRRFDWRAVEGTGCVRRLSWSGDPLGLFAALRAFQPAPHGGLVALGEETDLSLSPELFIETEGSVIRARPMKVTAPRGVSAVADRDNAADLVSSEKNRAENLMIVDLLRNDLSRVSEMGSVHVTDIFSVETYPTLFQLTSGIEAQLRPGTQLPDLFRALFPCGSITGAPKIRAMEVIRELEEHPRSVCQSLDARARHLDAVELSHPRVQARGRRRGALAQSHRRRQAAQGLDQDA